VRNGAIKYTRETWLGKPLVSTLLGMASVDVRSVGAGGGSTAWVDPGGLLNVGPQSAGSVPGPACYGRGGTDATVTDAAVVLGYIDPVRFLGGRMALDRTAAGSAVGRLAVTLDASPERTAIAILEVSSEAMIKAIEDITVNEGINPRESLIVAGGGAAGLTILRIAKRLGCPRVVIPKSAGALSAWGGQFSNIAIDFSIACTLSTGSFQTPRVEAALTDLANRAGAFEGSMRVKGFADFVRELFVEARYHGQQGELEVGVPIEWMAQKDAPGLKRCFDQQYLRRYGSMRSGVEVETINWRLRVSAVVPRPASALPKSGRVGSLRMTNAYFADLGWVEVPVHPGSAVETGARIEGPAIIEEPITTIVLPPGSAGALSAQGNYVFDQVD
jgi:N-methylhydantoinase A